MGVQKVKSDMRSGCEMTAIYHFLCNERSFRSVAAMRKALPPSSIISAGWSSKLRHDAALIGPSAVPIMLNDARRISLHVFAAGTPKTRGRAHPGIENQPHW